MTGVSRRALLAGIAAAAAPAASRASGPERSFLFRYQASVPAGAVRDGALDLWLPYPQSDRNQTIHSIGVDAPAEAAVRRLPDGRNLALHLRQPQGSAELTVTMQILATRRENSGGFELLSASDRRAYLQAEPLVPLDGPVLALARQATAGLSSTAQKARAIYNQVTDLLKYDKSGSGWGRGDALFACDARRGNCTDFHALIIGMARSQGIPARFSIGFSLPAARGAGDIPGYHCWAELYVNGRWVPVDSSEAARAAAAGDPARRDYYYGHHDENRIEFSTGRQIELEPRQNRAPLNYFIYPYAERDGAVLDPVAHRFSYRDVSMAEFLALCPAARRGG